MRVKSVGEVHQALLCFADPPIDFLFRRHGRQVLVTAGELSMRGKERVVKRSYLDQGWFVDFACLTPLEPSRKPNRNLLDVCSEGAQQVASLRAFFRVVVGEKREHCIVRCENRYPVGKGEAHWIQGLPTAVQDSCKKDQLWRRIFALADPEGFQQREVTGSSKKSCQVVGEATASQAIRMRDYGLDRMQNRECAMWLNQACNLVGHMYLHSAFIIQLLWNFRRFVRTQLSTFTRLLRSLHRSRTLPIGPFRPFYLDKTHFV